VKKEEAGARGKDAQLGGIFFPTHPQKPSQSAESRALDAAEDPLEQIAPTGEDLKGQKGCRGIELLHDRGGKGRGYTGAKRNRYDLYDFSQRDYLYNAK
jgi:hypothetical protein